MREKKAMPYVPRESNVLIDDASRLNETRVREIWKIPPTPSEAEAQLRLLLEKAKSENLKISMAGARHTMGGHVIAAGGIVIDTLPYHELSLDEDKGILHAHGGSCWKEIVPFLNERGFSPQIMQSNHDFSVGGSISANCHGWQTGMPPIASSVESFRLMLSNGEIKECSRDTNRELFSLALGGYGLFGIFLDVKLRVARNENYTLTQFHQPTSQYAEVFRKKVTERSDVGMAYGRLSVDTRNFLSDSVLSVLTRQPGKPLPLGKFGSEKVARLVFRGSTGSEYGKRLRWDAESGKYINFAPKQPISRNSLLNEPVATFQERSELRTDILHEYFVPRDKMEDFLKGLRALLTAHRSDLLNVTIRDVRMDEDVFLNYAREDVFGLVMLFNYAIAPESDREMERNTQRMIEVALSVGGTYYLPYRLHATKEQMFRAYPQATGFFALKKKYDPDSLFQNQFYARYGV